MQDMGRKIKSAEELTLFAQEILDVLREKGITPVDASGVLLTAYVCLLLKLGMKSESLKSITMLTIDEYCNSFEGKFPKDD